MYLVVNKNVLLICLPIEHQGVHKNSFRNALASQDWIGIASSRLEVGEDRDTAQLNY